MLSRSPQIANGPVALCLANIYRVESLAVWISLADPTRMRVWPLRDRANGGGDNNHAIALDPKARPDFLCVGAQKGGTTWLTHQLMLHKDFWMPPLKEVNYFNQMCRSRHPERAARSNLRLRDERDRHFLEAMESLCAQQHIDLDRYAQLFAPKGSLLSGDVSPAYCIVPEEIIAQIVNRFPELKVIFIARDPVERAWSDLSMAVRYGGMQSFDTNNGDEVLRRLLHPDIVMRSFQSAIVARWQRHVSPERFRLYFFDDLQSDPAEMRRSIIRFLGADLEKSDGGSRAVQKINKTEKKLPLTESVRSQVAFFFERELRDCAAKLGGAAKNWPARYGFLSIISFIQIVSDCDCFLDLFTWC